MKEHSFSDAPSIAREILAYLNEHPDAQDSIDGIMHWWLLEKKVPLQEQSIQEVLTDLAKKGLLNKVVKEARVFYKLNPRNRTILF